MPYDVYFIELCGCIRPYEIQFPFFVVKDKAPRHPSHLNPFHGTFTIYETQQYERNDTMMLSFTTTTVDSSLALHSNSTLLIMMLLIILLMAYFCKVWKAYKQLPNTKNEKCSSIQLGPILIPTIASDDTNTSLSDDNLLLPLPSPNSKAWREFFDNQIYNP